MSILVTGGAGYIGSHMVAELMNQGEDVVVIDNLSKGHKQAVLCEKFYEGDIRDTSILNKIFSENNIEAAIHFAADSIVSESVQNPLKYYDNNVYGTSVLLSAMNKFNTKYIVFSSTAATYGEPEEIPITENSSNNPKSPYGETKLAMEKMMKWASEAHDICYTSLRYFNACGAHRKLNIGEDHNPETHLIPIVLQAASGKRDKVYIFGNDYETRDGTCIRDYIHVEDLARAHTLALYKMRKDNTNGIYNLGSGNGFSVKEVIDAARRVTGVDIKAEISDRRPGDPAVLIASSQKAQSQLGWKFEVSDLDDIIDSAWRFIKNNPDGYGG